MDPEGEETIEQHITNMRRSTFWASQVKMQAGVDLYSVPFTQCPIVVGPEEAVNIAMMYSQPNHVHKHATKETAAMQLLGFQPQQNFTCIHVYHPYPHTYRTCVLKNRIIMYTGGNLYHVHV